MVSATSTTSTSILKVSLGLAAVMVFAASLVRGQGEARDPNDQSYLLAADVEEFLYEPLKYTFSCEGRKSGYYADVDNNCQVRQNH